MSAAIAAAAALGPAPAGALPVVDGALRIDVTTDGHLAELGVLVEPGGTTLRDGPGRLLLPVTGGDLSADGRSGQVELDGAEIVLRGGGSQVALRSLVFDLTFGRLLGGLRWLAADGRVVEEAGIPLFTARSCAEFAASEPCLGRRHEIVTSGMGLDWGGVVTQILADAFFGGVPIVRERDAFGLATLETQVVPEPAAGFLVGLGVAGLAAARRRGTPRGGRTHR